MILTNEQKEQKLHEQRLYSDRLEAKKQTIRKKKIAKNMTEAAIERMAITMLQLDEIPGTAEYEQSAGEHDLSDKKKGIELSEKIDFTQQDHDNRVKQLCQKFLDANPALRQREVKKTLVTDVPSDINYRDPKNHLRTKMHQAAFDGNLSSVVDLVDAGANTDVKDAGENTPFQLAVREENLAVAEYLKNK